MLWMPHEGPKRGCHFLGRFFRQKMSAVLELLQLEGCPDDVAKNLLSNGYISSDTQSGRMLGAV